MVFCSRRKRTNALEISSYLSSFLSLAINFTGHSAWGCWLPTFTWSEVADAATEEGGGAPAMTAAREEISVVISLGIFLAHSRPRSHLSRPASSLRRFCCIFRRLRPSSANLRSICVRGRGSEMNHELLVTYTEVDIYKVRA